MNTLINDVKFLIQYAKAEPEDFKKTMVQATVLVSSAMLVGVLAIKGATLIVGKK